MLWFLGRSPRTRPTRRRLLLFAAACCRRVAHVEPARWMDDAVAAAEALADGAADPGAVQAALKAAEDEHAWSGGIITPGEEAVFALVLHPPNPGKRFTVRDATRVAASAALAA